MSPAIHSLTTADTQHYPDVIMAWEIGDLVQLKSGGPTMTVTDLLETPRAGHKEQVTCTWYVGDGENKRQFDPAVLKRAEPAN